MQVDITLFLLVLMRMTGCVMFNSIFGRSNIPVIVRVGLTVVLSIVCFQALPAQTVEIHSFLVLTVSLLEQLLIGYIVGYVLQLFLSVIQISGENMDILTGLSMSKIYDPGSNVSMPLSASVINAMFILIFFATNAHLTLIKVFAKLCLLVPYEGLSYSPALFENLVDLFSLILIYAVKLGLPMLAAQLVTEVAVGIIMRAVPQIDVFVINIQVKLIIGVVVILVLVPSLAAFLERLITLMFDNINGVFSLLMAGT